MVYPGDFVHVAISSEEEPKTKEKKPATSGPRPQLGAAVSAELTNPQNLEPKHNQGASGS